MSSIHYANLDPQKREIRLLTLLPRVKPVHAPQLDVLAHDSGSSLNECPVRCMLKTISFGDDLSYVALSYTWGLEEPSATIYVDDQIILVRENLKRALQHIQLEGKSTTIWVDAICINQNDDSEKTRQVQMMAEIYDRAVVVLVWLGVKRGDSDIAMEKLESVGKKAIQAGMQDFRASDMANWLSPTTEDRLSRIQVTLEKLAEDEGLGLFHASFVPLSERDYWSRVWVLQELAVARDVVLLCGQKSMSLTTFMAASNFCAFARWRLGRRYLLPERQDPVIGEQLKTISAQAPSAAPNMLIGARRRYKLETGAQESLLSLLKRVCYRKSAIWPLKATNPKDKIYGILALASDSKTLGLRPDYTITTAEAYTNVTRAFVNAGQTTLLSWSQQAKQVPDLPSWVPDFSAPIREPCGEHFLTGPLFRASGEGEFSQISVSTSVAQNILGLSGATIDTITQLGSAWEPQIDRPFDRPAAQRLLQEIECFCHSSTLLNTQTQVEDAKMRIPCADQQCYTPAARQRVTNSKTLREDYNLLRLPEEYTSKDVPSRQYRVSMGFQHDRKPFLSVDGHVGLAPAHAEVGDQICIIFGATVPFVLREIDDGMFELVGEAYVHGVMDGEWLEEARAARIFHLC